MYKLLWLLLLPSCLISCKKKDQAKADDQIIQKYISDHHLNAVAEPNGLYYVSIVDGTGNSPTANSQVTVVYKGYLTDSTVFDQTANPVSLYLSQTIPGWEEGVPLMKKNGRATLLIPSALGYGSQGSGAIPANAVIIFDIQLLGFQ